jgi:ketosteroid isomerase-like protein
VEPENVALVRRTYERFNAGDLALDHFHPDVRMSQSRPLVGTADDFDGHEGIRQAVEILGQTFADVRFEPQSYEELPGGLVVVETRWVGRVRSSGAPVDAPVWHVWTIEDGLVTALGVHPSGRAARAAAGETDQPS